MPSASTSVEATWLIAVPSLREHAAKLRWGSLPGFLGEVKMIPEEKFGERIAEASSMARLIYVNAARDAARATPSP